ncbi:MAG TPA: hypothetical protein PLI96_09260 [Halothiobacillus sp.]|nr:hypothetical protein [Halothiobacillus sp.]
MNDDLTASMNHPSGRLAAVLLKKMKKGSDVSEPIRLRLDKLVSAPGEFGHLARVRLAAEVAFLFECDPKWTREKIIPILEWSSPEASAAWSARKYAKYLGSPELFNLTKQPFLEMFGRADVGDEDQRLFAGWLTTMMIANRSHQAEYPIEPAEARLALRRAGIKCLPRVGHRLAMEMEHAKPDEKIATWRGVVGPVFQSIWPLDIELQTSATTFVLVHILCASGIAFPEAVDVIVPFIRPDTPQGHTSVYSISNADDILYSSSPEKMLELIAAVVGDAPAQSAYRLGKVLERIRQNAPQLANSMKFQKLLGLAMPE